MTEILILFCYFILGISLNTSHGMFAWKELICISSSWLLMLIVCGRNFFYPSLKVLRPDILARSAAVVCALFSVILFRNPIILQQHRGMDADFLGLCLLANVFASLFLCLVVFRRWEKGISIFAIFMGSLLLLARLFTLRSTPFPFIDVFTLDTTAADYLVQGLNPYSQSYQDIYRGAYGYAPGYTYWPAVLYWQTISRQIFGDIRYGYIIADIATVWSIRSILKDLNWSKALQSVVPLLWLCFPVALFVLEESWVDVPLVACAALFLAFAVKEKWWVAGIFLGLFCSIKQYSIYFAIFAALFILWQDIALTGYLNWKKWNWRSFGKLVGSAFAVMALMFVPFMIWDWDGFYFNSVYMVLAQKIRWDALSFVPAFIRLRWVAMDFSESVVLYVVAFLFSLLILFRFSRKNDFRAFGFALALTYGVTFLFGKMAFCNYYYLLAFLVLIYFFSNGNLPEKRSQKKSHT